MPAMAVQWRCIIVAIIIITEEADRGRGQDQRASIDVRGAAAAAVNRLYLHIFNSKWSVLVGNVIRHHCLGLRVLTMFPLPISIITMVCNNIHQRHYRHPPDVVLPAACQDGRIITLPTLRQTTTSLAAGAIIPYRPVKNVPQLLPIWPRIPSLLIVICKN